MKVSRNIVRQCLFWTAVLAVILLPFYLFGKQIEDWTADMMRANPYTKPAAALLLGGLLASDILIPVPSSLASTACGYLLGALLGTAVSFAGMSISAVAGYWLGSRPGASAFANAIHSAETEGRMASLSRKYGKWIILIARPVPVLAEASVFFAGLAKMPFRQFLLLVCLSNLGISAVYAAIGAISASSGTFLMAFGGSILLPLAFMAASGLIKSRLNSGTQ